MERRRFLKIAATAVAGAGLSEATGTQQLITEEEDICQAINSFSWNLPPKTVNGEYVDTQGTLSRRTTLSKALLHPSTRVLKDVIWFERNVHWDCVLALKVRASSKILHDISFASAKTIPVTLNNENETYEDKNPESTNGKMVESIGKGLVCPGTHLLRVSRSTLDTEWTQLTITAAFPRSIGVFW